MRMTGIWLAIAHPHGAASVIGTGTYWFAIGLLAGVVASMLAPGWLTAVIVVFDLVALGWTSGILNYTHSSRGRWVLIAIPFLLIGLFAGVLRGLRHLGDVEFNTRRRGIRGLGRFL
jgi:hypothetical protein